MTAQLKQNILSETQQYLLNIFKGTLKRIVLYGSYARNTESEESDIDIFVLTDYAWTAPLSKGRRAVVSNKPICVAARARSVRR